MADQRGEYPRRPHRIGCAITAKQKASPVCRQWLFSITFPPVKMQNRACPILLYSNDFSAEYAQSKAEGIPIRPTLVQGGKPGCAAGAQPAVQQ